MDKFHCRKIKLKTRGRKKIADLKLEAQQVSMGFASTVRLVNAHRHQKKHVFDYQKKKNGWKKKNEICSQTFEGNLVCLFPETAKQEEKNAKVDWKFCYAMLAFATFSGNEDSPQITAEIT